MVEVLVSQTEVARQAIGNVLVDARKPRRLGTAQGFLLDLIVETNRLRGCYLPLKSILITDHSTTKPGTTFAVPGLLRRSANSTPRGLCVHGGL